MAELLATFVRHEVALIHRMRHENCSSLSQNNFLFYDALEFKSMF